MASKHEIIGEEWKERASELAEWAMENLVIAKMFGVNIQYSMGKQLP